MTRLGWIAAALTLTACGGAEPSAPREPLAAAQGVAVLDGYVRPAARGAAATAGYLTIRSDREDALVAASSPGFAATELHEATEADGVSRMRRVDAVPLPAGETVVLAPGGLHLMMMGPESALSEGDSLPVTLTFESGAAVTLGLPVQRRGPGGTDHAGH